MSEYILIPCAASSFIAGKFLGTYSGMTKIDLSLQIYEKFHQYHDTFAFKTIYAVPISPLPSARISQKRVQNARFSHKPLKTSLLNHSLYSCISHWISEAYYAQKYKALILKHKAHILKYMACIFHNKPCVFSQHREMHKFRGKNIKRNIPEQ